MKKHIHILGASGSGTTTLGKAISQELGFTHFDSDDYFWLPTNPPFTTKRPVKDRIELLQKDIEKADKWVLSGSNCGWGDFLIGSYDLVVFLSVPHKIRMERLEKREEQRYSAQRISECGDLRESHKVFMDWAASYDVGGMDIRSYKSHSQWLEQIPCEVIRIEGEHSVEERLSIVQAKIFE